MSESDDTPTSFHPIQEAVDLRIGSLVFHRDTVYRIDQILDYSSVMGTAVETGRAKQLRITELRPLPKAEKYVDKQVNLPDIADEDWKIACTRYAAIKPFLGGIVVTRKKIEAQAKQYDTSAATIYRWIKLYQEREVVSDLIPQKRGWKAGNSRLAPPIDEIVNDVLENFFLQTNRPSIQSTIKEVKKICKEQRLEPPSPYTIRHRISDIPEKIRLRRRGYKERAQTQFEATPGIFPDANFPLELVQIDHTPVDIILVDDVHRMPIEKPWLTLAMDVHTRMITGYYLTFDAPSALSVGMCLAHSLIPKEDWLALHEVTGEWPVWGKPDTVHADNGKDFRSENVKRACLQFGMGITFRPVKKPRYGAHIERLLGTFMTVIHELPGTTYSNVAKKGSYDSEKHSAMTMDEFEDWLVRQIMIYHGDFHTTIGMSPLKKWEIGVHGNTEVTGVGLPKRPTDRQGIMMHFTPAFSRTIQKTGVSIEGWEYYQDVLAPWIGSKDKNGDTRKFNFHRDPRDVSRVWFFDPDVNQFFHISSRNLEAPRLSLWEFNEAKAALAALGKESVLEDEIFQWVEEQRVIVDSAMEKTKSARKKAQRRKQRERKKNPADPFAETRPPPKEETVVSHEADDEFFDTPITTNFNAVS